MASPEVRLPDTATVTSIWSPGRTGHLLAVMLLLAMALGSIATPAPVEATSGEKRYVVVLGGELTTDGFALAGPREATLALIRGAGGEVVHDLTRQIGVLVVTSADPLFAQALRASPLVEETAEDFKWKAFPSHEEAVASGALTVVDPAQEAGGGGGPEETVDPLEALQWNMELIRAPEAHAIQAGSRLVQVGILDTGIDGHHLDFFVDQGGSNVDCSPPEAATFVPAGPGLGNPDPCTDNHVHGTHVAGIVAAQANGLGVVGVAPNVTLVPVKVCDTVGFCYSSATAAGITHAGDMKFEVINMSFFVDDNSLLSSTQYKCMSDPVQRAFRKANERAIQYARSQGVVPVASLGNSDHDLAHPPEPYENDCDVVPAETEGVIGTMAVGRQAEKASYSNYGFGMTDVAAPGGNSLVETPGGDCSTQVLSTLAGNLYGCLQGTSMAAPHASGVAALIVSQFGQLGTDGDVVMPPQRAENYLQSTTRDIVSEVPGDTSLEGYDGCFGNGLVDALRAVQHDTSEMELPTSPCPEAAEPPPPSS